LCPAILTGHHPLIRGLGSKMSEKWKRKHQDEVLLSQEAGLKKKVWGTGYSVCLAYPNVYRIGMANLGFQTVYNIFNGLPCFLCERLFLPEGDAAEIVAVTEHAVSLESQRPVRDFDILAFSVSFENDYPSILQLLESSGIPLQSKDRHGTHPLVMGGGIALSLNPEPLADFFDLFLLGEAEDALPRFASVFAESRQGHLDRPSFLSQLQKKVPSVYVPSLYSAHYFAEGKIQTVSAIQEGLPGRIRIDSVKNLDAFCTTEVISSPNAEMADMFLVEVNRGCPHLCRFCAAAHIYLPPRFRDGKEILSSVDFGLSRKKKIGLVGTAVSDHRDLEKICRYLVERQAGIGIASLRLDQITPSLVDLLKSGGIETVALAPEAGSQRLRDLLGKGIVTDDILRSCQILIEKEVEFLRLYFMVGLPTEPIEDVDAIIDLAGKIQHIAMEATKGRRKFRRITLSINQFIPKPRTPLQWCPLANIQEVHQKIKKIAKAFRRDRQIHVITDVPKWNYIQALLALGDRRVGHILLAVHYLHGNWTRALKEINLNPDFYVYRQKDLDEFLPWDILKIGASKEYLIREYRKAMERNDP